MKKSGVLLVFLILLSIAPGLLSGCSSEQDSDDTTITGAAFVFGDTTFNVENEEPDVNPHNMYSGWACIRYGIGETLFRYSDTMEIEPWLATDYELLDELTWRITLRDNVAFSSGRTLDGQAVKECLEHLVEVHDRAYKDLMIETIAADGQTVTITTTEPRPALLNYLSDPYGCIIDMKAGITDDGIVAGTGPYIAESLVSSQELNLIRNENYWDGFPGFERITVLTISDGDTLTMALQSGELDSAYGLPYASYPLFRNEDYIFSSCATSRCFFVHMNFESQIIQDGAHTPADRNCPCLLNLYRLTWAILALMLLSTARRITTVSVQTLGHGMYMPVLWSLLPPAILPIFLRPIVWTVLRLIMVIITVIRWKAWLRNWTESLTRSAGPNW